VQGRDINFYFTAAQGYKGKAFNSQIDTNRIAVIDPEIPHSLEAGMRSTLLDGKLTANLTIFHTRFEDFQAQSTYINSGGLLAFDIVNAGELETQGVEFEFVGRPSDQLRLTLSGAYTDATFTDFKNAPCYTGQTAAQGCIVVNGASVQDLTGKRLTNSPEWTFNVGAAQDFRVGQWDGVASISAFYRSDVMSALSNDPNTIIDAYTLVDMSLALTNPADSFTVTLFAKNVGDVDYPEAIFGTPFDTGGYSQFVATNARRTLGVSLAVRF
jgi:iron complex outermembrane recepter protein